MKLSYLLNAITHPTAEVLSPIVDRVGFASIATIAGIKTGVEAGAIELTAAWTMADTALLISMFGGITFIVKNIVEIYISYKKRKDND